MKSKLFASLMLSLFAIHVGCTNSDSEDNRGTVDPGHDGDGGAGASPEGGTPRAPVDATYKFIEFFQERASGEDVAKRVNDFVAALNTEGAAGYRYIDGAETGGGIVTFGEDVLLVKDSASTYSYQALPLRFDVVSPSTIDVHAELLQQMKTQGAAGFVFVKLLAAGLEQGDGRASEFSTLYRKDNGSNATYDYASAPFPKTATEYESLGNAQGANGFRHWASPLMANQGQKLYFIKDASSDAKYAVRALVDPRSEVGGDSDAVKAQFRDQGAQGYRVQLGFSFEEDRGRFSVLYVKDTTQAAVFEYESLSPPGTIFVTQELADQANAQARNGLRYLREPGSPIYFSARQCTGPLCLTPTESELTFRN